MTTITIPAPLWRRLAAAGYDGLLLLGIWMSALLIDAFVRRVLDFDRNTSALRVLLFLLGLGFFGRSWTHGGQTLGMRAWRLQLRREDGSLLRWPVAATRYAAMLSCWGVCLAVPLLALLPTRIDLPHRYTILAACTAFSLAGLGSMLLDGRRRAPHDRISGSEVVQIPRQT